MSSDLINMTFISILAFFELIISLFYLITIIFDHDFLFNLVVSIIIVILKLIIYLFLSYNYDL